MFDTDDKIFDTFIICSIIKDNAENMKGHGGQKI